jgi:hypothetical protein
MRITITIEMDEARTKALYDEYWYARWEMEAKMRVEGKEPSFPIFAVWLEGHIKEALENLTGPFGGEMSVRSNTIKMSDGELVDIVCRARGE